MDSARRVNYADRVGGANGDLDLLELIDGRLFKLENKISCRSRRLSHCMGESLLHQGW